MRNIMTVAVCAAGLLGFSATSTARDVNPNGFPSGAHYNLNIIGKKTGYNCEPVKLDEFGEPVYGNVIFVPDDGSNVEILMVSGKKGGRMSSVTELRVLDPCAGFDGDAATLELPPNDKGYRVFARALGKPSDDNSFMVSPHLVAVEDEFGNSLIELGLVTSSGFARTGESFTRQKGKSVAVDISGLFQWSGTVCTIDWDYDQDLGIAPEATVGLCWSDSQAEGETGHGVIDSSDRFSAPQEDGSCAEGERVEVPVACVTFQNEWVFNIADLVTYMWDTSNNKTKLLQVRFYPIQ